jgi:hypothetical protein
MMPPGGTAIENTYKPRNQRNTAQRPLCARHQAVSMPTRQANIVSTLESCFRAIDFET